MQIFFNDVHEIGKKLLKRHFRFTINTSIAPDGRRGDEFAKENLKKSLTKSSN